MNHLLRELAPMSESAWAEVDKEARQRLRPVLAARRLVDFIGPAGWGHSAVELGRIDPVSEQPPGLAAGTVQAARRRVLSLAELRVTFRVSRQEMDDIARGAPDAELDDLARAAARIAEVENRVVFHGWPAMGIDGLLGRASSARLAMGADPVAYPGAVTHAVDSLRLAGIEGPYALALPPVVYDRVYEATEQGYPLIDHLRRIIDGELCWVPGLDEAMLLSQRGGDHELHVGQDVSIGYSGHDDGSIELYFEESLTFRVVEPDASLRLSAPQQHSSDWP